MAYTATTQQDNDTDKWLASLDVILGDWEAPDDTAFIGVDLTNDFIPPLGALMVVEGDKVIPVTNKISPRFRTRVWTKEEHDAGHAFFASSNPGKKPLDTIETEFGTQYLWPDHCVKNTAGAEFHPDLVINKEDMIVVKGTDPEIHAYSAVYVDDRKTMIRYPDGKTLPEKLRQKRVKRIVIGGLAGDFCAGLTAYDLAKEGFDVYFLPQASRSIHIPTGEGRTTQHLMDDMLRDAGVMTARIEDLPELIPTAPAAPAGQRPPALVA